MNGKAFGVTLNSNGANFRLWAPAARRVDLLLDKAHAMQPEKGGWFSIEIAGAGAGARYKFRIDDEIDVPDPASEFQPEDVCGPSEIVDHSAFAWQATNWRGRPWQDAVILEAHVGTFTQEGTYRAMIERLDHLVETGITALELIPLADFAGERNWGYDGVLWYAPDGAYGRPEDLRALIDAAHLRGLMVLLDVVYNHFGPEGNYLGRYAPPFSTEAHTPWGNAIDYSVAEVRAFAVENAVYWLREYRFDGLRLDAVHAIPEHGSPPLLQELSRAVGQFARESGRHIHLVLENDDNRADLLDPTEDPPQGRYRAQWNDDYHHAWHVFLTDETHGYYRDYERTPLGHISRALGSGFVYQGEASAHRNGQSRGQPAGHISPTAFVNFLQNHDQIGNRAFGDRLETLVKPRAMEAALAITLLAPPIPMLFMGEEWGSKAPFPFFCDFKGDLAEAVRNGRRREYAWAYERYGDDVPDPLSIETFQSAKLDWATSRQAGVARLALVKKLLIVRRQEIIPRLAGSRFGGSDISSEGVLSARWTMGEATVLTLLANLSDTEVRVKHDVAVARTIWGTEPTPSLAACSVLWRIGAP